MQLASLNNKMKESLQFSCSKDRSATNTINSKANRLEKVLIVSEQENKAELQLPTLCLLQDDTKRTVDTEYKI